MSDTFNIFTDEPSPELIADIRNELSFRNAKRLADERQETFQKALAAAEGCQQVYLIQMATTKHVKVGIAKRPAARVHELQVGNPERLKLIATTAGNRETEQMLHVFLRADRLQGEWFRWSERTESLLTFILKHPKKPVGEWARTQRAISWRPIV